MKNIKEILTEGKKTFAGFNNDDIKCIYAALIFVDNSSKRDEFCKMINIDANLLYKLEQEFSVYVGKANQVGSNIAKLSNQ